MEDDSIIKALAGKKDKVVDRLGRMLRGEFDYDVAACGLDCRFVLLFGINLHGWGL
jgi:hypothetical protein